MVPSDWNMPDSFDGFCSSWPRADLGGNRSVSKNFKGGRPQFEAVGFPPKGKWRAEKKGQHVRRCTIFRPKVQRRAKRRKKKGSLRPQIVLYTYITFTPRKVCAFVWGGSRLPRPPSPWIRPWGRMRVMNHPSAIFKNVFDEHNFSIILNLFDSNKPYALSTHNRKCANKTHHIWQSTQN